MQRAGRRALPRQHGGSYDTAADCSRYDPRRPVPVRCGGPGLGASGGGVSADRLEER